MPGASIGRTTSVFVAPQILDRIAWRCNGAQKRRCQSLGAAIERWLLGEGFMPVKATCRSCQKVFQFPDWFLGRIVDCPNCKAPLLIMPKTGEASTVATTKMAGAVVAAPATGPEPPVGPDETTLSREIPPSVSAAKRNAPPETQAAAQAAAVPASPGLEPTAVETSLREDATAVPTGTSVSLVVSGLAAVLATLLFYVFFALPFHRLHIGALFVHRGPVPYLIMLLTFWSLAVLLLKSRKIAHQKNALEADVLPLGIAEEITPDRVLLFLEHLGSLKAKWRTSFFVNRVQRALTLFGSGRSVQEVSTLVSSQSDIDATGILSSYKMVKVFIWAIPILGFIGTVLGIGKAVGDFSAVLQDAQNLEVIKHSLGGVTSGLAEAFDTTLIALVMSIVIMVPMSSLQTTEENLLNSVDEFCNENLLRRLNERREAETPNHLQIAESLRAELQELRHDLQAGSGPPPDASQTLVREIATAWGEVRQRLDEDAQQVLQQLQEILRAVSAERRAFLEQVKSAQQEQVQQFQHVIGQFIDATQNLQQRVTALQKGQVDGLRDVLTHLKQDLLALQKQTHEQHQANSATLEQIAGQVLKSVQGVQQRAEQLPQTITDQLGSVLETVRLQLATVGGEAAQIFQQQIRPLHTTQQQIEASLKRSAAYLETAAQSETNVRKLSEQQVQQATAAARHFVETLNTQLAKIHQEIVTWETKGQADQQKRLEEIGRRLQLVANLSAERLEGAIKTSVTMVDAMNRNHDKLNEQTSRLVDVVQGQQTLTKSQDLLARNLAAVQASGQLLHALTASTQVIGQVTPVVDRLTQQVEHLATSVAAGNESPKRGWLPWT
jgi:biopolymer transport protein ExbB/TolQ